jgi:putative heme-binding domain-containing protein
MSGRSFVSIFAFFGLWFVPFMFGLVRFVSAQESAKNPLEGDAVAILNGTALFQSACADCHGIDAKGVLGPDLTVLSTSGQSDQRLFQTIRRGVPGTPMPSSSATDEQIWSLLAYLRTLATTVPALASAGDVVNGERIFWASCGSCHRVRGRGGHLGPDLSQVGTSRSPEALARDIRDASAAIVPGYKAVMLETSDGRRIRGVRKSEDAYSIRIMDMTEQLQGYLKSSLRDVINDNRSLMPDFGVERLNDSDLNDLLGFLGTLRAADAGRR